MDGFTDVIESKIGGLAQVVSVAAPLLANALGSPLSGILVSLMASAFGMGSTDVNHLVDKIQSDPNAAIKLKQIEADHAEALAKMASADYAVELQDKQNARQREVVVKDRFPMIIASVFLALYAVIQFAVIYNPGNVDDLISARAQDIFMIIISYYFGSAHRTPPQN